MDTTQWTKEDWDYYERAAIAAACAWIQRHDAKDFNPHVAPAVAGDNVAAKLVELKRERKLGK